MKKFFRLLLLPHCVNMIFFLSSCGAQKRVKVSHNYFELALLEVSDGATPSSMRRALVLLEKALDENKSVESLALKATLLFNMQHFNEAKVAFEGALAAGPSDVVRCDIDNNYACLLAAMGCGDDAIALWDALADSVNYATPEVALYNKGRYLLMAHDRDAAMQSFKDSLVLDSSYIDARLALACMMLEDRAPYSEVKMHIDAVLFLEPGNENALFLKKRLA